MSNRKWNGKKRKHPPAVAERAEQAAVAEQAEQTAVAERGEQTAVAERVEQTAVAERVEQTAVAERAEQTAVAERAEQTAVVAHELRVLKLRRIDGPTPGPPQTFTLPRVTVGRGKDCDLVVPHASVSILHCELRVRGEHVELRALDKARGLYFGTRRIFHMQLLPGDRFRVGDVMFELLEVGQVAVPVSAESCFEQMWGDSVVIREVFAQLEALAPTTVDVLLVGETGTGKELAARALHRRSGRDGPFTEVDCARLTAQALDHAFEDAHGGTLILDDLAELPLELQRRLRGLLDRRCSGREPPRAFDVRIVAVTHADLAPLVADGCFDSSLYFRLAKVVVRLPPLRERGDDIELLAARFLDEQACVTHDRALELEEDARQALREHPWPGNVRELRNVLQRAANLADGPRIRVRDLALHDRSLMGTEELLALPYRDSHKQLDFYYLRRVMIEFGHNITHAAVFVGTSRRSLRERLKRLGLYKGEPTQADADTDDGDEGGKT